MTDKELHQFVEDINKGRLNHADVDRWLDEAEEKLDGYGIEVITDNNWRRYYGSICALYVNMGDTYDTTVLYDVDANEFVVTSYGDWLEQKELQSEYRQRH